MSMSVDPKTNCMKSVYCFHFPETWEAMMKIEGKLPYKYWLVTTPVGEVEDSLRPLFKVPPLSPRTSDGFYNKDEMHAPIIDRIVENYRDTVAGLEGYGHRYPIAGSDDGIYRILARLKVKQLKADDGLEEGITMLKGDYEGPREYSLPEDLDMKVRVFDLKRDDVADFKPGYWYISNPSAIDGNILPGGFVSEVCENGNRVLLDLAYVGSTSPHMYDVGDENIESVFLSFSKPYGTFWWRMGFEFNREPVHSLYGKKWFKDPRALLSELRISEDVDRKALYEKYRPIQRYIVGEMNEELGLRVRPSDVLILGHMRKEDAEGLGKEQLDLSSPFGRGDGYRFCLTPRFEMLQEEVGGFNPEGMKSLFERMYSNIS